MVANSNGNLNWEYDQTRGKEFFVWKKGGEVKTKSGGEKEIVWGGIFFRFQKF